MGNKWQVLTDFSRSRTGPQCIRCVACLLLALDGTVQTAALQEKIQSVRQHLWRAERKPLADLKIIFIIMTRAVFSTLRQGLKSELTKSLTMAVS